METIIRIKPDELTEQLLNKIKSFIGDRKDVDVVISLKERGNDYFDKLNASIQDAEREEHMISFTMEEFMDYSPKKPNGNIIHP